jgi:hypothetical protein
MVRGNASQLLDLIPPDPVARLVKTEGLADHCKHHLRLTLAEIRPAQLEHQIVRKARIAVLDFRHHLNLLRLISVGMSRELVNLRGIRHNHSCSA